MLANSKTANGYTASVRVRLVKAVLVTLWIVVAFFVGVELTGIASSMLTAIGLSLDNLNSPVEMAVKSALMYSLATLVAVGVPLLLRRQKFDKNLLGFSRSPEWSDILLGPVGYIPYVILSLSLVWIVTMALPGFDVNEVQEIGFQTMTNQVGYSMAFFTLVVIAPIAEEILFRGYLYSKLKRYIGLIGAVLLTSLCFAVLHLQLNVGIDVFALSIMLCLLREFTGSIWAGILLHMTKNFIAFYFLFIAPMAL